jgi:putative transposase
MGRIPRWRMSEGIYHVYNRSLGSAMILAAEEEKHIFCDLVRKKLSQLPLNVYHYCVMGNHFHFAIEALDIRVLSCFVSGLSSSYTKSFRSRRHAGYGPLWQGRYKSIIVQKETYLFRLGRYIEQNPIRAKIVAHAGDWKWSSAASYLNWKEDGIVNPDRHPLLFHWPESPDDRRHFYLEYLQELSDDDLKMFDSDATSIGEESFKSKLANVAGRKHIRRGRPSVGQ